MPWWGVALIVIGCVAAAGFLIIVTAVAVIAVRTAAAGARDVRPVVNIHGHVDARSMADVIRDVKRRS